jgi:ABC-2 type transport system permease protein
MALIYATIAFAVLSSLRADQPSVGRLVADGLCVLAGVFGAAWLAAGIGALGTDPAADHVPKQPKQRYVWLYLYLAGSYCMGLAAESWSARVAALLVFGTLAWSLWQRVGDRLPWLLDPSSPGRRDVSAYDAGAAVTTFFLLQGVVMLFGGTARQTPLELRLLVSFVTAGALTVLVFTAVLAARGLQVADLLGVTTRDRRRPWETTLLGAGLGLALGLVALGWVQFQLANGWLAASDVVVAKGLAIGLLAVVAAPLCEEVLFRGLLFPALQRSTSPGIAVVWSAALFTVVHPPTGWLPLFLLGCATAALVARSRFLPAAMAAHATYNLVVVVGS